MDKPYAATVLRKQSGIALALFALAALPSRLAAHGNNPPYIAFWLPLSTPEVARCQRQIGTGAQRCAEAMLQRSMQCPDPTGFVDCSAETTAALRNAAIDRAITAVDAACSTDAIQTLLFRDLSEADTDMTLACDNEPQQMHALMAPTAPGLTPACRRQLAAAGRLFVRAAIRTKRAALDRIAAHSLAPSARLALINVTARRVARMRGLLVDRLDTACTDFADVIGQSPDAWLVGLEIRANCVIYAGYIQSAYTCPR